MGERRLLGILGAVIGALTAAPLAWLCTTRNLSTALVGLTAFLTALGGYRLLGRRCSGFGAAVSALLPPLAALPGFYYGYGELVLRDNARFGCTLAEALELVPTVLADPYNRGRLLADLGALLLVDILAAALTAKTLSLRKAEAQNPRKRKR